MTFLILSLCTIHWDMSGRSLDSLSFWYTANVRVKLRFSQNRKWADKNSSKQFLWRKLRETTNLWVEVMNSKRQVTGKFGHEVKIRVCQLTQTWCLTSLFSLLRGGGRWFPLATMNLAPGYFLQKTEKKNKTKEIPICFISRLLVVFTWQLEILATQLCKKTHGVQDHVLV